MRESIAKLAHRAAVALHPSPRVSNAAAARHVALARRAEVKKFASARAAMSHRQRGRQTRRLHVLLDK